MMIRKPKFVITDITKTTTASAVAAAAAATITTTAIIATTAITCSHFPAENVFSWPMPLQSKLPANCTNEKLPFVLQRMPFALFLWVVPDLSTALQP
jgi:hypothetical protein